MTLARRYSVRLSIVVALLTIGLSVPAWAQVTAGSVVGTISDPSGRVVARAEVRASDPAHGITRAATTDASGFYRFVDLPQASYTVTAVATGFRETPRSGVIVMVDSTARVDITLSLASVVESVSVSETVKPAESASGGLGAVIDQRMIDGLPLNRRDFLQLSLLIAGVSGPVEGSELSTRGSFAMHSNGGREEFNNFLLDGVDNNDPYVNRYVVQPSVDSVQEFKVATNGYGAEYGRSGAGQVNVVTRRGTNQLSGFGYEYYRNGALDAANYFDSATQQDVSRNQFGGGIGGPIATDRTFFFGTVDFLRSQQPLSRLATVPTASERSGNLSGTGVTVTDPFTGLPFPGNIIPASRISASTSNVVAMFPMPNTTGAANYLGQPVQRDDNTQINVRLDHRLSPTDEFMVRYSNGTVFAFEPYTEGTGVTSGYGDTLNDRTWNFTAQYQKVLGNWGTTSARFGANGFSRDLLTENSHTNVGAAWGVNWLNVAPGSYGYPVINVAGYSRVGDAPTLPIQRNAKTFQVVDDLSIVRGKHLMKAGVDVRHLQLDSVVDLYSRGQISFTGAFTGSGIGDLLLGLPTFSLQATANNPIHMRSSTFAGYLQDEWRVSPALSLTVGARYEYVSPPVDAFDGMTTLNPETGAIVKVGTNGVSRSGISPDRNNIAPRVSMSWRPAPGTVVRGAYGIYYDSGMLTVNTSQYFNPPQFNLQVFFPSDQGLLTLDNPFPSNAGYTPPATISMLDPNLVTGFMQHWNVSVQRDLASFGSLTVTYAGSKGSDLVRPIDLNQPAPGPGDVQARSPYPEYSNIFFVQSAGRSRYDSLQLTFNRPLSRSLSLLATYTLAKSNDDASAFLGTPTDKNLPQDSRNPQAEWGPSSFDVRHRFTMSFIVELPQASAWTRNTQIQGIAVLYTGQPFTPILRFDNSNTGNAGGTTAGSDRPNLVGNPQLAAPTATAWFNTAAFAVPAPYTFGNAGRNGVRGPGYGSFDLAISRSFHAFGRSAMTIGLQAFNLFNRTNFNMPEHYADEPTTFGRIFSANAPRQMQIAARFSF